MAEWTGRTTITAKVGRPVVVDEWAFPKEVTFSFQGEGALPDLTARFEMKPDGRVVCVELNVRAKPDGRAIGNQDVRLFDLDQLGIRVYEQVAQMPLPGGGWASPVPDRHLSEVSEVIRGRQTDEKLRAVARVYLSDTHGAPLNAVETRLQMPRRTAARWVSKARAAGLIPEKGAPEEAYEEARERLDHPREERRTKSMNEMDKEEIAAWLDANAAWLDKRNPNQAPHRRPKRGE